MRLEKIEINFFRNIDNIDFKLNPKLNIIYGENGQGKTNLLESIWLVCGSKSFRTNKDFELIKRDTNNAYIKADIITEENEKKKIEIFIKKDIETNKVYRTAKINDVDYKKASNIAGIFKCVVFAPEHLTLVKGSPETRRKFIDACLCQLYPNYLQIFKKYTRLLTQKNAYLKSIKRTYGKTNDNELLEVFDQQLAEYGALIVKKRKEFVTGIRTIAKENYEKISGNKEILDLKYTECTENSEVQQNIYNGLVLAREKDKIVGFSTFGPHKDDIEILLNNDFAKIYASQGQQRSIVISLKIAEADFIKKITQVTPVLLFDDVLSELDQTRQNFLLNKIQDKQVIITNCDYDIFGKQQGIIFQMEKGIGKILE